MRERLPVLAGIETVPLVDADGRIAAEDVTAGIDLPPFDNSAVDGYAVLPCRPAVDARDCSAGDRPYRRGRSVWTA